MIYFIVVDDNKIILSNICCIIGRYMKNKKYEYTIKTFNDYDEDFYNLSNSPIENKIYILDIEIANRLDLNGIDVAHEIYNKDRQSKIIFISSYENKYSSIMLRCADVFCGFISKYECVEQLLPMSIENALRTFTNIDILSFKDGAKLYKIPMNSIYYIEVLARKSIIHTNTLNTIETYVSLNKFSEMLNENFVRSHKACIVNKTRIIAVNKKKKIIYFDNNTYTNLLSKKYMSNLEI